MTSGGDGGGNGGGSVGGSTAGEEPPGDEFADEDNTDDASEPKLDLDFGDSFDKPLSGTGAEIKMKVKAFESAGMTVLSCEYLSLSFQSKAASIKLKGGNPEFSRAVRIDSTSFDTFPTGTATTDPAFNGTQYKLKVFAKLKVLREGQLTPEFISVGPVEKNFKVFNCHLTYSTQWFDGLVTPSSFGAQVSAKIVNIVRSAFPNPKYAGVGWAGIPQAELTDEQIKVGLKEATFFMPCTHGLEQRFCTSGTTTVTPTTVGETSPQDISYIIDLPEILSQKGTSYPDYNAVVMYACLTAKQDHLAKLFNVNRSNRCYLGFKDVVYTIATSASNASLDLSEHAKKLLEKWKEFSTQTAAGAQLKPMLRAISAANEDIITLTRLPNGDFVPTPMQHFGDESATLGSVYVSESEPKQIGKDKLGSWFFVPVDSRI